MFFLFPGGYLECSDKSTDVDGVTAGVGWVYGGALRDRHRQKVCLLALVRLLVAR